MYKLKTFFKLFLIIFLFLGTKMYSQKTQKIDSQIDSMVVLFSQLKASDDDNLTLLLSSSLDSLFLSVFSNKNSFDYDFSELKKYCSILKSDDGLFKIITWNVFLSTGEFKYFGYIQYLEKKSDKIFFYKLNDKSKLIEKPEYSNLSYQKWFGCIYYQIITEKSGKKTLYTLLGWDGNDFLTNKKIVEVVNFQNNKPEFGYNFNIEGKKYKRLIFEYNEKVKMILRWDNQMKMIIWDHLAPKEFKYTGMFQFYGPDFTYDGMEFKKKSWYFVDNVVVINEKEE